MQSYYRFTQDRHITGFDDCIPLPVFFAEYDPKNAGFFDQRSGSNRLNLEGFMIFPKSQGLLTQNIITAVIGCSMIGDRREESSR